MKLPSHPRRNLLRAPHWPSEVSSKGCLTRFRGSGRERGCGQGWSLTWALVTEISSISLRGAALLHQNKPMGRANRRVRRDLRASRTVLWNWVRWWDVGGGGGSLTLYQNCPGRNTKGAASARGAWPVGFGAGVCCVWCWGCLSFSSFCAHCAVVVKIGAVIKGYRPPGPAGEERIRWGAVPSGHSNGGLCDRKPPLFVSKHCKRAALSAGTASRCAHSLCGYSMPRNT